MAVTATLGLSGVSARAETTTLDFETGPDGSPTDAGQQLIRFPDLLTFRNPVEVVECPSAGAPNCLGARSGDRAIRPLFAGEFRREVIDIEFDALQDSVTTYVRLDEGSASDGDEVSVVFNMFDGSDSFIGSSTTNFEHDLDGGQWHEISVSPPPPIFGGEPRRLQRVEIWGGVFPAGEPPTLEDATNFLLVDDFTFVGDRVDPTPDMTPPEISLVSPSNGDEFMTLVVPVEIAGWDDSGELSEVELEIASDSGTRTVPVCGISPAPACGEATFATPYNEEFDIDLTSGEGDYDLTVTACDPSGNCTSSGPVTITLDEPDPPPPVRALKVEVTQGVQDSLFDVDGPGSGSTARSPVPLTAGRNTIVRYYLVAEGGEREDFSARLDVGVWEEGDDRPSGSTLSPNTGTSEINVPEDPGTAAARNDLVDELRADPTRTLNFVIPAEDLEGATLLDLTLEGVTGLLQIRNMRPAVTLGLNIIQLAGERVSGAEAMDTRGVIEHLMQSFPIVDVRVPLVGSDRWTSAVDTLPFTGRFGWLRNKQKCGRILRWVRNTYSGDTLPTGNRPDFVVTLGVAGAGFDGCLGMAYTSGTPTAITLDDPNVAPQEIVHTMGVTHASNDHDENDGGGFESWPYPHGGMSPDGTTVYGMIAQEDSAGEWDLTLVAPCLNDTSDSSDVDLDCSGSDSQMMHDFMSYGPFLPWTQGFFAGTNAFRWASDITFRRIYSNIASAGAKRRWDHAPVRKQQAGDRVEALIVSGVLREDGTSELDPLLRKQLPPSLLVEEQGAYELQLLDDAGTLLDSRTFDVWSARHSDQDLFFWLALPFDPNAHAVRLLANGQVFAERKASPNAPEVEVLSPNGGEVFPRGKPVNILSVKWQGSDADNDPLTYLVQYSPDDGESWQGLTLVENPPLEVEVDVSELFPGSRGMVRVTASDGFNTSVDHSDSFFSLGTNQPPLETAFRRTDCNGDGSTDISDAITTLEALFLGEGDPPCDDACDSNDDGELDISDAIASLQVLFLGEGEIPPPGMNQCGGDPTGDSLDCQSFDPCP